MERDKATHGRSIIKVGDEVIVVNLNDGDLAGLYPKQTKPEGCKTIPVYGDGGTAPEGWCYDHIANELLQIGRLYKLYKFTFMEKLTPGPVYNLRVDFGGIKCSPKGDRWYMGDRNECRNPCESPGWGVWYPNIAMWLGLVDSAGGIEWHNGDPWATVSGPPMIPDLLTKKRLCWCNFVNRAAWIDDCVGIQIMIRNKATLAYGGTLEGGRVTGITLCEGNIDCDTFCGGSEYAI